MHVVIGLRFAWVMWIPVEFSFMSSWSALPSTLDETISYYGVLSKPSTHLQSKRLICILNITVYPYRGYHKPKEVQKNFKNLLQAHCLEGVFYRGGRGWDIKIEKKWLSIGQDSFFLVLFIFLLSSCSQHCRSCLSVTGGDCGPDRRWSLHYGCFNVVYSRNRQNNVRLPIYLRYHVKKFLKWKNPL